MKNTHITKPAQTHSASHKISLSLLAIFFVCVLWGVNPSQAAAMMQVEAHRGPNNVGHQGSNINDIQARVKEYFDKWQEYFIDYWNTNGDKIIKGGVAITAVSAVTAGAMYYFHVPQASPATSSSASSRPVALSDASTILQPNRDAFTVMASDGAGWFDSPEDLAPSLKSIFEIAMSFVRKVTAAPVQAAAEVVVAAAPAAEVLQTAAAQQDSQALKLLKTHPKEIVATVTLIATYIYYKFTGTIPAKVVRDVGIGYGGASLLSNTPYVGLPAHMAPFYKAMGGPAFAAGRYLFDKTDTSKRLKKAVQDGVEGMLPKSKQLKSAVEIIPISASYKKPIKDLIDENWADPKGDDNGNNATGAARCIGVFVSDCFGGFLGLLALLAIFKLWGWYQKASNYTDEEKKSPQANVEQQKDKAPTKAKVDLSENLFLHIIHSAGIANCTYNLVDQVIKMLDEKSEQYTRHEKYNPKSKSQEIIEKCKSKIESWSWIFR